MSAVAGPASASATPRSIRREMHAFLPILCHSGSVVFVFRNVLRLE
jgi:hypothetical protein